MNSNKHDTREGWLVALVAKVTADLFEPQYEVPSNVRIACGFPSRSGLNGVKNQRIGECWGETSSGDNHFEIFISPVMDNPTAVAATVIHELCHTVAGIKAKHGAAFKRVAVHCGLEGKMTATTASEDLQHKLLPILDELGPYPMAALNARKMETTKKKQTARMLKVECPNCGYTARVSQKWIDSSGTPHCPLHGAMEQSDPTEEKDDY